MGALRSRSQSSDSFVEFALSGEISSELIEIRYH